MYLMKEGGEKEEEERIQDQEDRPRRKVEWWKGKRRAARWGEGWKISIKPPSFFSSTFFFNQKFAFFLGPLPPWWVRGDDSLLCARGGSRRNPKSVWRPLENNRISCWLLEWLLPLLHLHSIYSVYIYTAVAPTPPSQWAALGLTANIYILPWEGHESKFIKGGDLNGGIVSPPISPTRLPSISRKRHFLRFKI